MRGKEEGKDLNNSKGLFLIGRCMTGEIERRELLMIHFNLSRTIGNKELMEELLSLLHELTQVFK